jgi:unsaturated rhamnogalacturonyl hydrolase
MKKGWLWMPVFWVVLAAGAGWGVAAPPQAEPTLAVRFADSVLQRWPNPTAIDRHGWEYNSSIVLVGVQKVYERTKEPKYLKYIQKWVDSFIDGKGNINFKKTDNNLDHLHPGLLLLFLYDETGLEKYKKAAQTIRQEFDNQPRNAAGGFWHKQRYPNEMWADGIYMAQPFLAGYGVRFGEREYCFDEATFQTILIADHLQDSKTGLVYHGWDQDRNAAWADPETGRSPMVWCRGMGWYLMALVEILDDLPKDHPRYGRICEILAKAAAGARQAQDPKTGLWYQVLDRGDRPDNWIETSGSAMFVYALKKAVENGYLDPSYRAVAQKGWEGLQTKVSFDERRLPVISGSVQGMGVQESYENYIHQKLLVNSSHGLCGIMLAAAAMEY